jgi:sulfate adenylyltransferase
LMMDSYYPKTRVVVGAFFSFARYAGPREAVFTALVRKNFGCTHFIVGRDHTGVGDFYKPYAARDLFDRLGDIGIRPIHFNEVYYCDKQGAYVESDSREDKERGGLRISGSEARQMFLEQRAPPEWFMRKEIGELIREEMKNGREVFVR